jgi:GNAT superfamily N-acetyltransferase
MVDGRDIENRCRDDEHNPDLDAEQRDSVVELDDEDECDFDSDIDADPDGHEITERVIGDSVSGYTIEAGQPVGLLYVWVRGDQLPEVESPARLTVRRVDRPRMIGNISDISIREVEERIRNGHVPYIAFVGDTPVACGWSAWKIAAIGELGITIRLPRHDHYLWDFVTLPEWRDHGIYRKMLQEIINTERDQVRRFWVGHDYDNLPSGRGIVAAGFTPVGEVWSYDGDLVFAAHDSHCLAGEAAAMLSIPLAASS